MMKGTRIKKRKRSRMRRYSRGDGCKARCVKAAPGHPRTGTAANLTLRFMDKIHHRNLVSLRKSAPHISLQSLSRTPPRRKGVRKGVAKHTSPV